jgi:uncharacterized membrane protein YjjP (DUF1212 family)
MINLKKVEILNGILDMAFGDPNQVGTASAELDKLTQGSKEFSPYYAEFQYLITILDYNTNVIKAALKYGVS